ncbi:hypothetical protein PICMEDRAFT_59859 [Pichia membranifaciens NRRL Y-2026]|uniref:ferric-chelate reductase (NADPH) n=1 Tax=Pichia membranifaciens NRRL Y-2026 TaxID=763406 RepID=A0A1E3NFV2_9ASCO|nr:hypothetical protein PICMEDRAFT_59859 [Pichia membranifaciens NRRL Y-2026]ODQ45025.1 hypothetical protein PICMEDRAFT_59859 [Pichia membranifaciens NRRL Y-2026]
MKVLYLLVSLVVIANALVISDSHVASSCIYFFRKKSWDCNSASAGHMNSNIWNCQCLNIEWLGSITNCINDYSNSTKERDHAYEHIRIRCNGKAKTNYTLDEMKEYQLNATKYLESADLFPKGTNVTTPIEVDAKSFAWWYKTFRDYNYFISMCQRLGWGCVGFWIGIVGLSGIYNYVGYKFIPYSTRQIFNRHLTYRYDAYCFGLNRLELLICFLFFVQVLLMCCINYSLELNSYLYTRWFLLLDLISFRTDIIAFSLMPVLYLTGIRNNPFQYFGCMSHATMIKFHKFIAIIFFILAVVHSVIWTHYARSKDGGGYAVWAADAYFYWGIVGTIVIGIMIGFSIELVRNLLYEVFLFFHLSFSVLFVAAMWKHCETLGWMGWVYSLVAILCFDWVARFTRIASNGFINSAQIEIYGPELVKLEFEKPVVMKFYPGSYVYLHILSPVWSCWQSHPFSLIRSTEADNKMIVYLKCKRGLTRRLSRLNEQKNINVLIDGPYGVLPVKTSDDEGFDEVIGIGGGLGISSVLAFFNERARQSKLVSNYKLNWLINDLKQIELISNDLEYLKKSGMKVTIYYTRYDDSSESAETEKDTDSSHSFVQTVQYGKPSIETLLPQSSLKRRVYICASESLIQSARHNLSPLDELIVENHTW